MRTFRYKPLPKTDTLLTIQLQTSYYEVAILLVNISMFGYHNNYGSRKSAIYRFSSTTEVRSLLSAPNVNCAER